MTPPPSSTLRTRISRSATWTRTNSRLSPISCPSGPGPEGRGPMHKTPQICGVIPNNRPPSSFGYLRGLSPTPAGCSRRTARPCPRCRRGEGVAGEVQRRRQGRGPTAGGAEQGRRPGAQKRAQDHATRGRAGRGGDRPGRAGGGPEGNPGPEPWTRPPRCTPPLWRTCMVW